MMRSIALVSLFWGAICAFGTEQITDSSQSPVVQKCQLKDFPAVDEGCPLYIYFTTDKIAYIEENVSMCGVALHIRYLYDEDESFVTALCRLSTLSEPSNEWIHSQIMLTSGQVLHIDRLGITENIDERAKRVMALCREHLLNQRKR